VPGDFTGWASEEDMTAQTTTTTKQNRLHRLIRNFVHDEVGAVSTEEAVIMGGVVVIALLAFGNFSDGAQYLATDRQQVLSGYRGISSSADNTTTTGSGGAGGGAGGGIEDGAGDGGDSAGGGDDGGDSGGGDDSGDDSSDDSGDDGGTSEGDTGDDDDGGTSDSSDDSGDDSGTSENDSSDDDDSGTSDSDDDSGTSADDSAAIRPGDFNYATGGQPRDLNFA